MIHFAERLLLVFRDVCLPIILLIGVGWVLDKKFRIHLASLVKLNIYLFVPAFIFVQVTESTLHGVLGIKIILFTLTIIGSMWLCGYLASALKKESSSYRKALQLSTMFYNCGNFGVPLMALAYPARGPVVQVFVLMTMNISTFTIGLFLANSQNADPSRSFWRSFLPILTMPPVYAICLAWIFKGFDVPIENVVFIWRPLKYLAGGLVAVALVTLGVQLSQTRHPPLHNKLALGLIIRLMGGPLIAVLLTLLFGFEGETARVLILGASAPTAVNVALIALEYKADSEFAAATVFYSTLISVVTVTLLLVVLNSGLIPWTR